MIVSLHLLYELQTVLMRQKFRRYRTEDEALEFVIWIRECATLASEEGTRSMSRDPDDDYLLALAETSDADYLVSGDGDLLDVEDAPMKIIPPRTFHEILESSKGEN